MKFTKRQQFNRVLAAMLALVSAAITCGFSGCQFISRVGCPEVETKLASYEEIRSRLSDKKDIVFPDISEWNLDASTMEYILRLDHVTFTSEPIGYVIAGFMSPSEDSDYYGISCLPGEDLGTGANGNIYYKGVCIEEARFENRYCYSIDLLFFFNGYQYKVIASFDVGKTLEKEALANMENEVFARLYSIVCQIIDSNRIGI